MTKAFEEYKKAYQQSIDDPETFWAGVADHFTWKKKWDKVLDWSFNNPKIEWFAGAKLNITENCLDRHLELRGDQTAIVWEPNNPDKPTRTLTYRQLHAEVCKTANMLRKLGIQKGDRVCIYLPMIPEAAVAMLACARIGAIHPVFQPIH
jgi:acetyl-CoA synthetase